MSTKLQVHSLVRGYCSHIFHLNKFDGKSIKINIKSHFSSVYTLCLKNDTDVAHYNFNGQCTPTYFGNFWQRCCWESAIQWWFVIAALLTNVSAPPGETWTLEIVSEKCPLKYVFVVSVDQKQNTRRVDRCRISTRVPVS